MGNIFYVYAHCRPDGSPFYVGKGKGKRSRVFKGRNLHHKNTVLKYGKENILVEILETNLSEADAFALEREYILGFRILGNTLVNQTDGGEGQTGPRYTQAQKLELSNKMIGDKNPFFGKKHSPETIEKLKILALNRSEEHANKLKWAQNNRTDEHKKNMLESLRKPRGDDYSAKVSALKKGNKNCVGRVMSDDTRNKIAVGNTGRTPTEDTRLKLSNATKGENNPMYGRKHSEETKKKISEAAIRRNQIKLLES